MNLNSHFNLHIQTVQRCSYLVFLMFIFLISRGHLRAEPNAVVRHDAPGNSLDESKIDSSISDGAVFENKKYALATCCKGNEVLINRGSLNKVSIRDIYFIYGPDYAPIAEVEVRSIGELRSIGKLYYLKKSQNDLQTKENIPLVFAWQRKSMGLGFSLPFDTQKRGQEPTQGSNIERLSGGGGVLLEKIFRGGKSIELLLGTLNSETFPVSAESLETHFRFPFWFKKSFDPWSKILSPSVAVGLSYYDTSIKVSDSGSREREENEYGKIAPMVGLSFELFPKKPLHFRCDVQKFYAQYRQFTGNDYRGNNLFFLLGSTFNW